MTSPALIRLRMSSPSAPSGTEEMIVSSTRRAYARTAADFLTWCEAEAGVGSLAAVPRRGLDRDSDAGGSSGAWWTSEGRKPCAPRREACRNHLSNAVCKLLCLPTECNVGTVLLIQFEKAALELSTD